MRREGKPAPKGEVMSLDALVQAWRLGYTDGQQELIERYQHCRCPSPESATNVVELDDFRSGVRRDGTN